MLRCRQSPRAHDLHTWRHSGPLRGALPSFYTPNTRAGAIGAPAPARPRFAGGPEARGRPRRTARACRACSGLLAPRPRHEWLRSLTGSCRLRLALVTQTATHPSGRRTRRNGHLSAPATSGQSPGPAQPAQDPDPARPGPGRYRSSSHEPARQERAPAKNGLDARLMAGIESPRQFLSPTFLVTAGPAGVGGPMDRVPEERPHPWDRCRRCRGAPSRPSCPITDAGRGGDAPDASRLALAGTEPT